MDQSSIIDNLSSFETPEGVVLAIRPAGPVARGLAWALDALIRYVALFVLLFLLSLLGHSGIGLFLLAFFLLEWFYPVIFEAIQGATPGKKALGLTVVHDDGTPVNWSGALVRNLLRTVDVLPGCYGFGLISMLIHPRFKRIGDLAAGTLVVYAPKPQRRHRLPDAEPIWPEFSLTVDEQRAIIDFAERSGELSRGRQQELAAYLSTLPAEQARALILSYAQGLTRAG